MDKIFFTYKIPDEGMLLLKRFDVEVNTEDRFLQKEEIIQKAKDAAGLVTLLSDKIDAEVFESLPKLKVIANYAVGYNNIDIDEARKRGIRVTNTPEVLTDATADLTLSLMLAVSRRIVEADRFVREHRFVGWKPDLFTGPSLSGKTLGIIGLGRIGKAVAERAKAFGMNIVYCNRKPLLPSEEEKFNVRYLSLEELLRSSDFISLHVPLTRETYHLLNEKRLSMIKTGAVLINTARGPIVNEAALIESLRSGRLAAAGLDVYEEEPEVPQELIDLGNVVLLPHIGSATKEARTEMAIMVGRNVAAVLEGKEPPNPVV
ncbi:D-glycerate dehydrogenase [Mesotoga sp.]|jgi:glyoxylate reductase|uniref:2-hydroxyacid dehydrogenase n=1 Tax=Mesotoga sp. TaxID=2053577 RepID=UPI0016B4D025|nr:D-glycerate dehydrogenase [Mesotoga sp.]MDI9369113.1 D-glycerate dehydrogenase [Thermotogota bacterium]NLT45968.1 D-glycerate dehydrogenase [Thermotogaceae bacterium]MDD3680026.1 D-glycerate dehydrogenase [Mesotoga sp.]MDD4207195.1 D-glycerate dehydrogenase [Mesotoga sp.]MDD4824841.1 D-glycerate dehydrogenase [Mesotoga sp.]